MNSLTLNSTITQLCCSVLTSGFQYQAMINNQWLPVTHKFAEIVWDNFRKKHTALVKIGPLSYSVRTLAKSSVRIETLNHSTATHDALSVFFCVNACAHLFIKFFSMVALVGQPKGWLDSVGASSLNPANVTATEIETSSGDYNNQPTRAVIMTTIPNEIVSNKPISMAKIDIINKKLLRTEAILYLLTANSTAEIKINDNLVTNALWAISDLVADARSFLHNDKSKEVNL